MTRLASEDQVVEFVRAAREEARPFEIVAGGTKRKVGRPLFDGKSGGNLPVADVSGLAGIIKYEPEELILTVKPGTTLNDIKSVLAAKNQCLGFDPVGWSFLDESAGEKTTIGGAISADASGSGRLRHGAARDSLLGFRGVNGFGDSFGAGSKVVKNVTGFDLPKLVCGAFGTLCVLTELTFRVYPKAKFSTTIALKDLTPEAGFAALRKIWHSALEPTGLAYQATGRALIRFEGEEAPLWEKCAAAKILLGAGEEIEGGDDVFAGLSAGTGFVSCDLDVWRIVVPPSEAAKTAAALASPLWYGDWAGGLLWAGMRGEDAERVRVFAAQAGGHAMLLRAPAERRAALGLFAPQPAVLATLSARVKDAFDPLALFNPGRV